MSENVFDKALISDEEWSKVLISRLSSRPNAQTAYGSGGYDAKAMKEAFDAQGNLLKERHNKLVNYARAEEGARAVAESERKTAESKRRTAETARDNAEIQRQNYEIERNIREEGRATAEEQRQINEFGAVGNYYEEEANAVHNSLGEVIPDAEGGRVGAEIQRRRNETEREKRFSEMERALGDLDSALDELHGYAQALIGGGNA